MPHHVGSGGEDDSASQNTAETGTHRRAGGDITLGLQTSPSGTLGSCFRHRPCGRFFSPSACPRGAGNLILRSALRIQALPPFVKYQTLSLFSLDIMNHYSMRSLLKFSIDETKCNG